MNTQAIVALVIFVISTLICLNHARVMHRCEWRYDNGEMILTAHNDKYRSRFNLMWMIPMAFVPVINSVLAYAVLGSWYCSTPRKTA